MIAYKTGKYKFRKQGRQLSLYYYNIDPEITTISFKRDVIDFLFKRNTAKK